MKRLPWFAMLVFCLVHGLAVVTAPAAAQAPFTVEQILSSPFPSGLVTAPQGGAVAWVFTARGVRNVWVAESPAYQARRLTGYTWDSGRGITDLTFTADGKALLYTRRPDPTPASTPNPLSLDSAGKPALWLAALAGGEPRKIAEGSSPVVSKDGKEVFFLRDSKLFRAPLAGKGEPKELLAPRGDLFDLRLSPDGKRLAFTNGRDRHSFVGVFDLEAGELHWLDPGVDSDSAPAWSPDGREVAFVRRPATRDELPFFAVREAEPWSIRALEWATGKAREVFRAERGRGSAYWDLAAADQILWTADGRMIFPWEKEGWVHLYAVPAQGGPATLLTPGEFEVESAVLSADRTTVFFSSNQGDLHRRHLWKLAPGAGAPVPLTRGTGIEWLPAPVAGGDAIALLRSDARGPARPAILVDGQSSDPAPRDLAPREIPADFPAALVEPQPVDFPASDGLALHGQLFLPAGLAPGERRPAVAFFHGGSRRQMLLGWHYMDYYHHSYAFNQLLASRGFVVLSVNYRSGIGYGMEFREAERYGAGGGSELADVLGAGLYLAGRPDVDPRRIGLWGGSYGGYLTAMGLAHASHLFAAGVDVHGVHDWNDGIQNFVPTYQRLADPERARRAFESSPLAAVDGWRSPVLLIHGDDDRNVNFAQTIDLVVELRKRGVETEELVFPDDRHDFELHRNWERAFTAALDFFERRLGSRR